MNWKFWQWKKPEVASEAEQSATMGMQALPVSLNLAPASMRQLQRHVGRLARLLRMREQKPLEFTQEMIDEIRRRRAGIVLAGYEPPVNSKDAYEFFAALVRTEGK